MAAAGVPAYPAGLAELIARLAGTAGGAGAVHLPAAQLRELFLRALPGTPPDLGDAPADLVRAARDHLRQRFWTARAAVTGVDFAVAETGTLAVLEPEGAARMGLTLPRTLVCVAGIEQVVPSWADLEVLLQLLPPAADGDRMSACVSTWTGVAPGDGPEEFHLVLLDDGRAAALADEVGRAALRCVRCMACADVCPVYERTGPGPYGPGPPGPIGAIWTPLLRGVESAANASLPYASTLCGACADVCPVKIDIPEILVRLRGRVIESRRRRPVPTPEMAMMRGLAWTMGDQRRYESALRNAIRWARLLARGGRIQRLPGLLGKWTEARDLPAPPREPFRSRWRRR
jgi:L-lactate dehydrogenase complex protein LldF